MYVKRRFGVASIYILTFAAPVSCYSQSNLTLTQVLTLAADTRHAAYTRQQTTSAKHQHPDEQASYWLIKGLNNDSVTHCNAAYSCLLTAPQSNGDVKYTRWLSTVFGYVSDQSYFLRLRLSACQNAADNSKRKHFGGWNENKLHVSVCDSTAAAAGDHVPRKDWLCGLIQKWVISSDWIVV